MSLRAEKALVSLGLPLVLHPTFQAVAALASTHSIPPPAWLATPLDRGLPLVPDAAWVYLSWYPATAAVLLADRLTFRRAYAAYLAAFVVCVAVYPLFPVTIARPALPADQNLSVSALAWVYAADRPVNLFPSFHAAVAAILWRLRSTSRVASAAVSAWVVALCLACVLTKQHFVLDVVAGLAVGGIAVTVVDLARRWFAQTAKLTPHTVCSVGSQTAE